MKFRWLNIAILFVAVFTPFAAAEDWPQWRGKNRDGISTEKGLLQTWPKDGPKLLWTYRDAGIGFAGPAVVGNMLYTLGGFDEHEYVIAIDLKSKKEKWRTKVGPLFTFVGNFWGDGPRSTPAVTGDLLYALGGQGILVCLKSADGSEVWRKDLINDLGGVMMTEWGYSESPFVDGDNVLITPGGMGGTVAALNAKTGADVWRSKGLTNKAPYSSIVAHSVGGVKEYVQTSYIDEFKGGVVSGIRAKDGHVLWTESIFKNSSYAIAPTPIVGKDWAYITCGYGGGCHLFQLTGKGDTVTAKDAYSRAAQRTMKNTHGGVVLIGDHIYGHSERYGWVCQELKTGKIIWSERFKLECRSGAICAAGGRLILLSDEGETVLQVPNPKHFEEVGRFKLPESSKLRNTPTSRQAKVWTHPIVANGQLILRDQELIFVYDVKAAK